MTANGDIPESLEEINLKMNATTDEVIFKDNHNFEGQKRKFMVDTKANFYSAATRG